MLSSLHRSFKIGPLVAAHLVKLGFYLEQHAPHSQDLSSFFSPIRLDFSQTFNNPRAALKVYPKDWRVFLSSTLTGLPHLVSTVRIPRDLLLIKRGRMSVQALRSTLSPQVWEVFGDGCCIVFISANLNPGIMPGHRHQKALNYVRCSVLLVGLEVLGSLLLQPGFRIGVGWQNSPKGPVTASSRKGGRHELRWGLMVFEK